ncbi:hypothetical protein F4859DRAFT_486850 [Xylaria cf. heliscus]|nr:hypothetical protein F4859DRAFT_486850 [Xylaria cf. heliscus]
MICYTAYALLVMGLASQTLAEPSREPYQPKLARMSTRSILGLDRRDVEGYSPTEQLCGAGDTCAEACGSGFRQCASKDNLTHCYNRTKKQLCCPGGTGASCDNGYFCTSDEGGETWCCPGGLSLKECAQKYNIPGPLTSQAPQVSTTSTTTTTTTKATKTKSADSSETSASTDTSTKKPATTTTTTKKKPESTDSTTTPKTTHHESTSKSGPKETTIAAPSTTTLLIDVSSTLVSTEAVATQTALDLAPSSTPSTSPASSSTSSIGQSGGVSHGPANGLVLFIAGALVALV